MAKMIFVNLPVANVAKATAFYEAIGMTKNPMFSNEQASAMEWSDTIMFMLLDHAFYATFTDKKIIDAKTTSGVLLALSRD
ncbi:MAG: lactoylglutathione lyase, partial [Sphingomonadales bacterium]|nr:lactoylglutathione lyase [Sphingomonadales bacterium]